MIKIKYSDLREALEEHLDRKTTNAKCLNLQIKLPIYPQSAFLLQPNLPLQRYTFGRNYTCLKRASPSNKNRLKTVLFHSEF